ncbi:hypothetical protein [Candidatus Nitrosocosmicus sp. FF01]|jgi:hypothetical protein|uniref:hypothetical protein n=1 Tax=Candidatus Nitrosocosmicus sp. FF01 TaxID=3397670 RepID=UPI0039ED72AE
MTKFVTLSIVFVSTLILWVPMILHAQQIPSYYNFTSNMKNGTDNVDPQFMMSGWDS